MPTGKFLSLAPQKQSAILRAAVAEFSSFSYGESSTNRIVQACGISKGSLFQYFPSKEELYFFLLDQVTGELQAHLQAREGALPRDLFRRVRQYAEWELDWYLQNPEKCRLLLRAFTPDGSDVSRKTANRYAAAGQEITRRLLKGVDTSRFRWEEPRAMAVLEWVLRGYQQEFLLQGAALEAPARAKADYLRGLDRYLEVLKAGLTF